jgi:uncharacterized protein (DUF305 family)
MATRERPAANMAAMDSPQPGRARAPEPMPAPASTPGPAPDEPAEVERADVDVDGDGDDRDDEERHVPGLSWTRVAVLGAALAFLGFAVGFFVTRDQPPSASSADVGFLQDMITHHDQALGVAALTVAYGENASVRTFAREVLTQQSYEVGVMTQMLAEWGFSRDERSDEAMAWMGMPVPVEQMPGLLTDEQLAAVDEARGAELDQLFLELMAEHHRGGLHMAQAGAELAGDDDVAELAARLERNQASEINEYRQTAERLGMDIDIPPADIPPEDLPETDD